MIFGTIVMWSGMGLILLEIVMDICGCDGYDILNPMCIYEVFKVNYFGCVVLMVIFNLLCPLATAIYWFYKLCTVGRK